MPTYILKFGDNVKNRFAFDKPIVTIGRSNTADIVIENLAVSRKHAQIEKSDDGFYLVDLQSANGTFLNGQTVEKQKLKHFDTITVGKHQVVFLEDPKAAPVMGEEPSPFDFDRTVVVNPNRQRNADLTPPAEEIPSTPLTMQPPVTTSTSQVLASGDYVASTFSSVYHSIKCEWVQGIKNDNRVYFEDRANAEESGRRNCRICMPDTKS